MLGQEFRGKRQAAGRRIHDIAKDLGVSPSKVSCAERGVTSVAAEEVERWAEVYGMSWSELLSTLKRIRIERKANS